MPIQKVPVTNLDDLNHRRRVREVLNQVLDHSADDSRRQTDAEKLAGITPVNPAWPPFHVRRYGAKGDGVTDDLPAFDAAMLVAHTSGPGGEVYADYGTYRLSDALIFDPNSIAIRFWCAKGAVLLCDHNSHGVIMVSTNENFGAHVIENWHIKGPNTELPAGGYVPPSTGAAIYMSHDLSAAITVAQYNSQTKNCVLSGFLNGMDMQNVIGHNDYGSFIQFNQVGIKIDGGQTNGNHFYGTHIRYNRLRGISSTGRAIGANATKNAFIACLIESNIPYPFASGGAYPTDSTGVYLNNSYDFDFIACYDENHAAAIYLTNGSKGHRFISHRFSGGTGREDRIVFDGAGIYSNTFLECKATGGSAAEVSVESNSADQLYNTFPGCEGINFLDADVDSLNNLHLCDVRPNLNYTPSFGIGLVRIPPQGYRENVGDGTNPGSIDAIGGSSETLYMRGVGLLRMTSGMSSNTTVDAIEGALPLSQMGILNYQDTDTFALIASADIVLKNKRSISMNKIGQFLKLEVGGDGIVYETGRNFSDRIVGNGTVSGAATTQAVTFAGAGLFDEPNTSYKLSTWVESITGTPAAGSYTAYATAIATTGFTLNVPTAPGVGNTVTFGWEAIRLDT